MMKGQIAGLMRQAQQMQENMKKAQDALADILVEGAAGGNLVKVTMTCRHDVKRVTIDPSLLAEDKDMLEDLVAAAFSDLAGKDVRGHRRPSAAARDEVALLMDSGSSEPQPLVALVDALRRLPGVGVRTARRMAYHLLQHDREAAGILGAALTQAVSRLRHCERCNGFTEAPVCATCAHPSRDASLLCIVETPADQNSIEATHGYQGLYYVLMGRLAPLEGMGPDEIDFGRVLARAADGVVQEVILATNFTAEGETTAHYLSEALRSRGLKVTRLARGVPAGSEIEYVDAGTVAWALMERRPT